MRPIKQVYPYPCCRCGFCCIAETCPIGQATYGVPKSYPCPGLSFDGDEASCKLALDPYMVGIGQGCCIRARAISGENTYDFASLPPSVKKAQVRRIRQNMGGRHAPVSSCRPRNCAV
jgi:hypothetical protein